MTNSDETVPNSNAINPNSHEISPNSHEIVPNSNDIVPNSYGIVPNRSEQTQIADNITSPVRCCRAFPQVLFFLINEIPRFMSLCVL